MHNIISIKLYLAIFLMLCFGQLFSQSYFVENKGQYSKEVIAKKNIIGGALFIEKGKFTFSFYDQIQFTNHHKGRMSSKKIKRHSYTVSFKNKSDSIEGSFSQKINYKENFYLGKKSSWAKNVSVYKRYLQKNIYPGINLLTYVFEGKLKYDLHVLKGSNHKKIKLKYSGHEDIYLNKGNLIITTSVNTVTELKPVSYQLIKGKTVYVKCNYKLLNNVVSFDFPNGFNKEYDLIIDPVLVFSTYSGSVSDNFGYTATYDNLGFLYSGSTAFGTNYPTTIGAYQTAFNGGVTDIAITKYDTSGTYRIFSTYLGGVSDELPHSMVVNSNNELFILGTTGSINFPTTYNAFDTIFDGGPSFFPSGLGVSFPNGSDMFVSKLSNNGGSLISSTFLGGTDNDGLNISSALKFNYADEIRGEIDIDNNNNVYIVSSSRSEDFPTTSNVFQSTLNGDQDGCLIKLDNQLSTIVWSSFLGGSKDDAAYSLAIDEENNVFVTGGTISDDFPTTSSSYNEYYNDSLNADAFIAKINSDGTNIISSSYFGSSKYDQSYFIDLNDSEQVYIFGQTKDNSNSLVFNSSYFINNGGQFISVLNNNLSSLVRSTVFGTGKGSPDISPTAFLVDRCNNIYISGWGSNLGGQLSTLNLPTTYNAFQNTTDGNDFYLAIINEFLDSLEYATYFGGSQSNEHVDGGTSRFDKQGIIYQSVCAGCGNNNDFPIFPNPGAVSTTNNSNNCNNAVFKFDFKIPLVKADFFVPTLNCSTSISFLNNSSYIGNTNMSFFWDFGDGNSSSQTNPTHQYSNAGIYQISLIATSLQSCNISDTISKNIYISSSSTDTLNPLVKCDLSFSQIGITSLNDSTTNYSWLPIDFLSDPNVSNPYTSANNNILYELIISNGSCNDTLIQEIFISDVFVEAPRDTSYCSTPILLGAISNSNINSIIWSSNSFFLDTLSNQNNLLALSPNIYYVKVSDSICFAVDSVNVLSDLIDVELIADTLICRGDTVNIKLNNITTANPIISFSWNPSNLVFNELDSSEVSDNPINSSIYSVEVFNSAGCYISDSIYIKVVQNPVIDSLWSDNNDIISGSSTTLHIITNDSILWFNESIDSVLQFSPDISAWYFVTVYNNSCLIRDSVYLFVRDLICSEDSIVIPTGFTPNNDNVNDFYEIKNKGVDIIYFNLKIYNRLGQVVFSSNDIDSKWDGTFNGVKLHAQVFDFFVDIQCSGGKKLFKKGNITLIE